MRRTVYVVVIAIALGALVAAWVRLFGSETASNSSWGLIIVQRRWGIEREIRVDRNRDGNPDVLITYPGRSRTIGNHDRPTRILVDNDLDGTFELEWRDGAQPTLSIKGAEGTTVYRGRDADLPNDRLHILSRKELGLNEPSKSGT